MLRVPGMLLIGATGRNVGKTELACSLIRQLAHKTPVVGVKVTTINEKSGECPRGGDGCGVCSSLSTDWHITEETDPAPGKDTARLKQAGAARVFWLRVMTTHLREGFEELSRLLPPGVPIVCESNSLRTVVRPDLFVMVKDKRSDQVKPTAQRVRHLADAIFASDGSSLDTDLAAFDIVDGRWTLRRPATAIVLAGGRSSRMGRDKSLLKVGNSTMLDHIVSRLTPHFNELLLSVDTLDRYVPPSVRAVPDRIPGLGPFMAVATCLEASSNDLNLVVACDMPGLDVDLATAMLSRALGHDGVIPQTAPDRFEPLFAVYRKSLLPAANRLLASGELRILALLTEGRFAFLQCGTDSQGAFTNLNTPEEFEQFTRRLPDLSP